jgi:hypothetical protein
MSLYADKATTYFYLNLKQTGDQTFPTAVIRQTFADDLLKPKASDWVCSITRFNLPLQTVPYIDAINNFVIVRQQANAPAVGAVVTAFNLDACYSIDAGNLIFRLKSSGRVQIYYNAFNNNYLELHQTLADILSLPTLIGQGLGGAAVQTFIGDFPIQDRCDQLQKITFEALGGLPVKSEILTGDQRGQIITDFLMKRSFGISYSDDGARTGPAGAAGAFTSVTGFTEQPRQDLVYTQSLDARPIILDMGGTIRGVAVQPIAIYKDGSRHLIRLAPRSVFEVKIMFVKKI